MRHHPRLKYRPAVGETYDGMGYPVRGIFTLGDNYGAQSSDTFVLPCERRLTVQDDRGMTMIHLWRVVLGKQNHDLKRMHTLIGSIFQKHAWCEFSM